MLVFLFLIFMICFPGITSEGIKNGLQLWYHSILPVLFPFMILCSILIKRGTSKKLPVFPGSFLKKSFGCSPGSIFTVFGGFICGFPIGAKLTYDLSVNGGISRKESDWLYGFVNNLSPLFLLAYVGRSQLMLESYSWTIPAAVLGSALIYGIMTAPSLSDLSDTLRADAKEKMELADSYDLFTQIDQSIAESVENILKLCGYIVLFSMVSHALCQFMQVNQPLILILISMIEVTNGIHLICSSSLGFFWKYIICVVLCASGGLSALMQTISIAHMKPSRIKVYIKSRVRITLLSALLAMILYYFVFILLP